MTGHEQAGGPGFFPGRRMEIRKRYGKLAGSQVNYTVNYNLKNSKNIVGRKRDPPGRSVPAADGVATHFLRLPGDIGRAGAFPFPVFEEHATGVPGDRTCPCNRPG